MFDNALSFLKGIEVKEENAKTIRVLGMKAPEFLSEVTRMWKTSKITANLFRNAKSRQLDLHPFFAPDFYYICKRLMGERKARINRTAVTQVVHQLETNTWMRNAFTDKFQSRLNYDALNRFKVTPLPHQSNFLKHYDEMTNRWYLKGYILAAAAGSGKTLGNLFLSECLDTDITICIVPKNSVVDVWRNTFTWAYKEKPLVWDSLSGDELKKGYRYYIAHYEQLERLVEFFSDKSFQGKKINIVLDESHNLNELKSQRTLLFVKLCEITKSQNTVWSSGTPLKAMGSEVIPILRTIDPFFDQEAEERFKNVYGLSSARGLDILAHRLGYMSFKIDKDKVVGNTVEKYRIDVTLKNGNDYTLDAISKDMSKFVKERLQYYQTNMKMYMDWYQAGLRFHERTLRNSQEVKEFNHYVNTANLLHKAYDPYIHKQEPIFCNAYEKNNIIPNLPKDLKEHFKDSRAVYKYVKLKVQGEALSRVLGKKRLQCNLDMLSAWDQYHVTDLQTGEKFDTTLVDIVENSIKKTVIFTSYVEVVDKTASIVKQEGGFPLKVYGETNHELPQIISQFFKDPRSNPLIATIQSLSTAVPLIAANSMIFLNAPFRDHLYTQACARIDRLGQTETVHIYDVFLDTGKDVPNISTRSQDILQWSADMVNQMLGTVGGSSIALEDLREDLKGCEGLADLLLEEVEESPSRTVALESYYSW